MAELGQRDDAVGIKAMAPGSLAEVLVALARAETAAADSSMKRLPRWPEAHGLNGAAVVGAASGAACGDLGEVVDGGSPVGEDVDERVAQLAGVGLAVPYDREVVGVHPEQAVRLPYLLLALQRMPMVEGSGLAVRRCARVEVEAMHQALLQAGLSRGDQMQQPMEVSAKV